MSVLLFFIDGLGIGKRESANPLFLLEESVAPLAVFQDEEPAIIFDGVLSRTDANLGIAGRPQSASGQTTILTGINTPEKLGHHKQGFPNAAMREILAEHSVFLQLEARGIVPNCFANAYSPRFFAEEPRWKSATTCAVEAAAMRFKTFADLKARNAVFHDFSNTSLRDYGIFDIPEFSPAEAARILAKLTTENRFTLYEYFITDKIGHDQSFEKAEKYLPALAEFLRKTLENLDLNETTVIMTSDHGNLEDLSVRNHTLNQVPTIIWGKNRRETAAEIKSLADITPAIIRLLTE